MLHRWLRIIIGRCALLSRVVATAGCTVHQVVGLRTAAAVNDRVRGELHHNVSNHHGCYNSLLSNNMQREFIFKHLMRLNVV